MEERELLKGNGRYIVELVKDFYLADIQLNISNNMTLKEYDMAQRVDINGCLHLSGKYPPQSISIRNIDYAFKVDDVLQELANDIGVTGNDVIMPFIGGIIGDDFRVLYGKLCETDGSYLSNYKETIKTHYRPLFEAQKPGKPVTGDPR